MAFKQPLKQTRHDVLSTDPNIQSDSERNTTRKGMIDSFSTALGVAASFFPLGRLVKGASTVGKTANVATSGNSAKAFNYAKNLLGNTRQVPGEAMRKTRSLIQANQQLPKVTPQIKKSLNANRWAPKTNRVDAVKAKNWNLKEVPVVGKPGKTVKVFKDSGTQQVSYANPRISMTAAERKAAGY
jgi:hypothetical protein